MDIPRTTTAVVTCGACRADKDRIIPGGSKPHCMGVHQYPVLPNGDNHLHLDDPCTDDMARGDNVQEFPFDRNHPPLYIAQLITLRRYPTYCSICHQLTSAFFRGHLNYRSS